MRHQEKYQICNRCVMDTSDAQIEFDDLGHCQYCTEYLGRNTPKTSDLPIRQQQWDVILENIRRKGRHRDYDCILGISGGVDSSYCAHLCKEWGLRTLLFHMDNGWNSDSSVKNIKRMVEALGFDYVTNVLDWSEFREIQLAFFRSSIVDLEYPTDIGIAASTYNTAAEYGAKYIISGGNVASEGILPLQMGYHVYKDMRLYNHIVDNFSSVPLNKTPTVNLIKEFYYKFLKNIRTVYPLDYLSYDKDQAKTLLINKYGWEDYGAKHHESRITAFWQSYVMPTKYDMDYRRVNLASRICAGQIERAEALELLLQQSFDPEKIEIEKNYIAKKYGISRDEFDALLSQPPKTYADFPNKKEYISAVFRLYNILFSKKGI